MDWKDVIIVPANTKFSKVEQVPKVSSISKVPSVPKVPDISKDKKKGRV